MKKTVLVITLLSITLLSIGTIETNSQTSDLKAQKAFFKKLKKMCGKTFEGATEFPTNADHALVGKKLLMKIETCTDTEIRIPFLVGEDKSRTWIITLDDKGLLFKHDHRHADGTPDKITNYGGFASADGTKFTQKFPADADTAKLIPEATTNVWTLQTDERKKRFMYQLERDDKLRYRAFFKLKAVSD
ncbi:MAG TPA: hypothetical protein VNI60_00795 [Pyrinomonadaceae bacterium]|nr:hypothetical protein [Pyrinomonadaceae bacterium]